jgi:hypothetical protein
MHYLNTTTADINISPPAITPEAGPRLGDRASRPPTTTSKTRTPKQTITEVHKGNEAKNLPRILAALVIPYANDSLDVTEAIKTDHFPVESSSFPSFASVELPILSSGPVPGGHTSPPRARPGHPDKRSSKFTQETKWLTTIRFPHRLE